jgi:hypothetical protein
LQFAILYFRGRRSATHLQQAKTQVSESTNVDPKPPFMVMIIISISDKFNGKLKKRSSAAASKTKSRWDHHLVVKFHSIHISTQLGGGQNKGTQTYGIGT